MHFSKFLLTLAAGGLAAVAAIAQDADQANEAREKAEPAPPAAAPASAPPAAPELEPAPSPPPPAPAAETPASPSTATGDTPSAPAPPLTRAQVAELERTTERGRLLIAIARAGIVATQDMLTRVADPEGAGIVGWIAEPAGNAMAVTFYADGPEGEEAARKAVFRANVAGSRIVSREVFLGADRPALSPLQRRMAAARAAARGLDQQPCGGSQFNYLVVPPPTAAAPVDVYRMTAPTQRGRFPLGGHFRATVAADGTVSDSRGFANSCVDVEGATAPPAGGQPPQPIGVTHVMDPMPTEVHVFLAQMSGRPLLVATGEPQRVWLVTPERIAEVRP